MFLRFRHLIPTYILTISHLRQVTYSLLASEDVLEMDVKAETDAATPLALSNHAYWNLSGNLKNKVTWLLDAGTFLLPLVSETVLSSSRSSLPSTILLLHSSPFSNQSDMLLICFPCLFPGFDIH